MKKKLLATAIAATLAAPAASFAVGPVLYGQGHVSVDYIDNNRTSDVQFSSNISRIGVKGGYDLNSEWEAIYLMEWEVDMTDPLPSGETSGNNTNKGNDLKARNRYVGFKNPSWGTLTLGRQDTPVKVIGREVDLFWSSQLGQNRSLTAVRDASGAGPGFDFRADNTLAYKTPDFGPVYISAAYIADHNIRNQQIATGKTDIQDDNSFNAYSGALIYDQELGGGSLFLAAGYERHDVDFNNNFNAGPAGLKDNEYAYRATGKYSIGDLTFTGFYQKGKNLGFVNGADRATYGGGASYQVGQNTFKGQVYYAGDIDDYSFGEGNPRISGSDTDAWLYSLGIDHAFSKSVQIYAQGAILRAGKNAFRPDFAGGDNPTNPTYWSLGGSGHGAIASATPDENTWGVSIGTRVKF